MITRSCLVTVFAGSSALFGSVLPRFGRHWALVTEDPNRKSEDPRFGSSENDCSIRFLGSIGTISRALRDARSTLEDDSQNRRVDLPHLPVPGLSHQVGVVHHVDGVVPTYPEQHRRRFVKCRRNHSCMSNLGLIEAIPA